ncbi:MAG: ABC transporter ATP-binding protein [Clostridia bacterium]|nr:ABC transporter ATP-binding protein [Clostridia bacterium]
MFKGLRFFLSEGWRYDKKYVLWLALYQIVNSMIPIAASLLPKFVIDELTGLKRIEYLIGCVGVFAGYVFIANALSGYFFYDGFSRRCVVAERFYDRMREHLALADLEQLESPACHEMRAQAEKFLTCAGRGFGYLLDRAVHIAGQLITLIGLIAILSTLNGWFVLAFSALAILCSAVESRATEKSMRIRMEAASTERYWTYFSGLFESTEMAKEIRLNGARDWLLRKSRHYAGLSNDCYRRSNNCYILSGAARSFLTFVQQCMAYAFLAARVLTGGMGVGSFSMCISAVASFSDALRRIMDSFAEIRAFDLYYDKLEEYLNLPKKLREGKGLPVKGEEHRIELHDVSFRYAGAERWALRHVNLTIEPGMRLSLVGENGSGKTTLIKLLCRLYDPTEGHITMDGTDIRDFDYDSYLTQFSTVFQDLRLFDFSLRDNLCMGRDIGDGELMRVLDQVGLREKTEGLPKGLDTHIGRTFDEQGFEPSGGEAQKIALARALCRNAPIVILDEPTAAMDARAEYELYRQFDGLAGGKTAVYISHRMSASRFCDAAAVLHQGRLIEYGTHDELIAKKGKYAELYALQAQYYTE